MFWRRKTPERPAALTCPTPYVFFDKFSERLCRWIANQEAIVGCVAWITRHDIFEALAQKKYVAIVLRHQRPEDMGQSSVIALVNATTHAYFSSLNAADTVEAQARYWLYPAEPPAFGKQRRKGVPPTPLLHHKFLVGGRLPTLPGEFFPEEVWCGSWNFTVGSDLNKDTVMIVRSAALSRQFYEEWRRVWAESIPFAESPAAAWARAQAAENAAKWLPGSTPALPL